MFHSKNLMLDSHPCEGTKLTETTTIILMLKMLFEMINCQMTTLR